MNLVLPGILALSGPALIGMHSRTRPLKRSHSQGARSADHEVNLRRESLVTAPLVSSALISLILCHSIIIPCHG